MEDVYSFKVDLGRRLVGISSDAFALEQRIRTFVEVACDPFRVEILLTLFSTGP
jgi:hypothetical protein